MGDMAISQSEDGEVLKVSQADLEDITKRISLEGVEMVCHYSLIRCMTSFNIRSCEGPAVCQPFHQGGVGESGQINLIEASKQFWHEPQLLDSQPEDVMGGDLLESLKTFSCHEKGYVLKNPVRKGI